MKRIEQLSAKSIKKKHGFTAGIPLRIIMNLNYTGCISLQRVKGAM
ncbi:hypothetical protein [Apibacter sp. HY039]|nr:hypothetical protein [Apibacter sp. HY039]